MKQHFLPFTKETARLTGLLLLTCCISTSVFAQQATPQYKIDSLLDCLATKSFHLGTYHVKENKYNKGQAQWKESETYLKQLGKATDHIDFANVNLLHDKYSPVFSGKLPWRVTASTMNRSGEFLAMGSDRGNVTVFNINKLDAPVKRFQAEGEVIVELALCEYNKLGKKSVPDAPRYVVIGTKSHKVLVWDMQEDKIIYNGTVDASSMAFDNVFTAMIPKVYLLLSDNTFGKLTIMEEGVVQLDTLDKTDAVAYDCRSFDSPVSGDYLGVKTLKHYSIYDFAGESGESLHEYLMSSQTLEEEDRDLAPWDASRDGKYVVTYQPYRYVDRKKKPSALYVYAENELDYKKIKTSDHISCIDASRYPRMFCGRTTGGISYYDLDKGKKNYGWRAFDEPVQAVYYKTGKIIGVCCNGEFAVWMSSLKPKYIRNIPLDVDSVKAKAVMPLFDGLLHAVGCEDGRVRLYTRNSERKVGEFKLKTVSITAMTADNNVCLCADRKGQIWVVSLDNPNKIRQVKFHNRIREMVIIPGTSQVVSLDGDDFLVLWDYKTGKMLMSTKGKKEKYRRLVLCGDKQVAAGATGPHVALIDVVDNKLQLHKKLNVKEVIYDLAVNPSQSILAVGSNFNEVRFYSLNEQKWLDTVVHDGATQLLALSFINDDYICTGGKSKWLDLREVRTGELMTELWGRKRIWSDIKLDGSSRTLLTTSIEGDKVMAMPLDSYEWHREASHRINDYYAGYVDRLDVMPVWLYMEKMGFYPYAYALFPQVKNHIKDLPKDVLAFYYMRLGEWKKVQALKKTCGKNDKQVKAMINFVMKLQK